MLNEEIEKGSFKKVSNFFNTLDEKVKNFNAESDFFKMSRKAYREEYRDLIFYYYNGVFDLVKLNNFFKYRKAVNERVLLVNAQVEAEEKLKVYDNIIKNDENEAKVILKSVREELKLLEDQLLVLEAKGPEDLSKPKPWLKAQEIIKMRIVERQIICKTLEISAKSIEAKRLKEIDKGNISKFVEITAEAVKNELNQEDQKKQLIINDLKEAKIKDDKAHVKELKKLKDTYDKSLKKMREEKNSYKKDCNAKKAELTKVNGKLDTAKKRIIKLEEKKNGK